MAVGAWGPILTFFEGGFPLTWKLLAALALSAVIAIQVFFAIREVLEDRRLQRVCPDCIATLSEKRPPTLDEVVAHKVRIKKD